VVFFFLDLAYLTKKIENNIKKAKAFIESPETAAALAKTDAREELLGKINIYYDSAQVATNALKTKPYLWSEVLDTMENTIKASSNELGIPDTQTVVYEVAYKAGFFNLKIYCPATKEMTPKLPAFIVQKLEETDYFYDVEYPGYKIIQSKITEGQEEKMAEFEIILKLKGEEVQDEVLSKMLEISGGKIKWN